MLSLCIIDGGAATPDHKGRGPVRIQERFAHTLLELSNEAAALVEGVLYKQLISLKSEFFTVNDIHKIIK